MVAALGDFDVGRGFWGGEEARGGFVVEVGGQQMGSALPCVAAGTGRSGVAAPATKCCRGRLVFVGVRLSMRAGEGFLSGAGCGRLTAEDVEGRGRGGSGGETCGFENRFELAGADDGVHFGDALADFVAVALDQAADDDELFGRARGFVAGHFEDGVDGLLFGGVDEAACVDDEDFGFLRMRGQARAGAVQQTHHHLGVNEVFGTAQRNKAHGRGSGWGGFGHHFIVPVADFAEAKYYPRPSRNMECGKAGDTISADFDNSSPSSMGN